MIDKTKIEIKKIEKILEENMKAFPACSRVVVTKNVEELRLDAGLCGTVFSTDELGNLTICWDDLRVTTTNYLSYEFISPNVFSIFQENIDDTPETYSFYGFIESLRNIFQPRGLYIEGCTNDLSKEEIESIISFSLDTMMKFSFDGYSYLEGYDENGKCVNISLNIFDNENNTVKKVMDVLKNPDILDKIFESHEFSYIINYLKKHCNSIDDSLNKLI